MDEKEIFLICYYIVESIIDLLYMTAATIASSSTAKESSRIAILVTGGYGFIASHFIQFLYETQRFFIINVDALYYCSNENNVNEEIRSSPFYLFVHTNITNDEMISFLLKTYHVAYVVHFAAQTHVDHSFYNASQFIEDNVVGTHSLIRACHQYGNLSRFVHISTDEVYGESPENDKKVETDRLDPTNPYAASKAAAELVALSYYKSFGFPLLITRGNNVYGTGQYAEKVIPKFIHLLSTDQKVTIQGKGDQRRSFLHVRDTVEAIYLILHNGTIGEIYNIGGDQENEMTVYDLACFLIRWVHGQDAIVEEYIDYIPDRPFNDQRYLIDTTKLKSLGWKATIPLPVGLSLLLSSHPSLPRRAENKWMSSHPKKDIETNPDDQPLLRVAFSSSTVKNDLSLWNVSAL